MKTYLVCEPIEGGGFSCVNAIEWDEAAPFTPPEASAIVVKLGDEWIGWSYANGWLPPDEQE